MISVRNVLFVYNNHYLHLSAPYELSVSLHIMPVSGTSHFLTGKISALDKTGIHENKFLYYIED